MAENRDYDIALSFAGEERDYVDRVANLLKERGVKVFYDLFEEANLWGKDLYVHLSDVYLKRARFTVMCRHADQRVRAYCAGREWDVQQRYHR